jgi:hypothetical protein
VLLENLDCLGLGGSALSATVVALIADDPDTCRIVGTTSSKSDLPRWEIGELRSGLDQGGRRATFRALDPQHFAYRRALKPG